MQKWWSILFGVVMLAEFGLLIVSPAFGWWLPKNIASYGPDVDQLFYFILWATAFFFILTEVLLVWAMWRYAYDPARKAQYVEGNTRLELLWTLIPGVILLVIAFAQVPAWMKVKFQSRMPQQPDQVIQITARQWEWRFRYHAADGNPAPPAGAEAKWADHPELSDLRTVNEIHTWKGAKVKLYLKTEDVIHSFFLPNLRLKQDALPGKTIPLWFDTLESNTRYDEINKRWVVQERNEWELACAELCGGRHYAMRGRLYVHPTREDYLNWLKAAVEAQRSVKPEAPPGPAGEGKVALNTRD